MDLRTLWMVFIKKITNHHSSFVRLQQIVPRKKYWNVNCLIKMITLHFFRSHYPTFLEGTVEALIGLTFYVSVFHGLIVFFQKRSKQGTSKLSEHDILEISNKTVSSIFAIVTCSLALKVYGECGNDLIHGQHNLIRHYMCFAVFYFVYDTYAMFVVFKEGLPSKKSGENTTLGETVTLFLAARPLIIVHHMVLPFILFPVFMVLQTGLGDCLLAVGFLMEASTPFVSARKILSVMGLKNSLIYRANGLLMTIVFFCCRILVFPIIYSLFAQEMGVSIFDAVFHHIPWFCSVSTFLIWLPQIYWFYLMIKGCLKVINQLGESGSKDL